MNQHILITGASRGIGREIAKALAHPEACVSLIARDVTRLEDVRAELGCKNIGIHAVDISKVAEVISACDSATDNFGPVTLLVNNAGAAETAPINRTDAAMLRRMMDVNFYGAFSFIEQLLPGMFKSGLGKIINIGSTAALEGYAYVSAYCAAKHALLGFTRALAKEVIGKGIAVAAVCPGFTDTDFLRGSIAYISSKTGRAQDEIRDHFLATASQDRFLQPQEIAAVVKDLCDEPAETLNGKVLRVESSQGVRLLS